MKINQIYLPESTADQSNLDELLRLAAEESAEVIFVSETVTFSSGKASLTLYPPLGSGTSNDEGLFALCSYEDFDLLITGDADSFVEQMLVKYYPIPDLELLMVGHHGSKHSTSAQLLEVLRPELAVISVGYNSYGHPADETLERLASLGAQVRRTDLDGPITITLRDGTVAVP